MKPLHAVYAVSFALHVVGAIALDQVEAEKEVDVVSISMTTLETPKEEEKPKPPEPEPVAAVKPVARAAPPKAAPAPESAPPPPDFGFVMSGGPGGPGGVAVPTAAPPPPPKVTKKVLAAAVAAPESDCGEPEVKPRATSMPHPSYTDEARAAAIEGKVRVQLTLTPEGAVAEAKAIEGLGHGLDEAAIAALREAKFSPATKCGKAVASTFTVSVRFAL